MQKHLLACIDMDMDVLPVEPKEWLLLVGVHRELVLDPSCLVCVPDFGEIGVLTRGTSLRQIPKLCNLSRVEVES